MNRSFPLKWMSEDINSTFFLNDVVTPRAYYSSGGVEPGMIGVVIGLTYTACLIRFEGLKSGHDGFRDVELVAGTYPPKGSKNTWWIQDIDLAPYTPKLRKSNPFDILQLLRLK